MLYMDPEECIDCDDCVEARPIDAITPKDELPPEWQHFIAKNAALLPRRAAVTHGQSTGRLSPCVLTARGLAGASRWSRSVRWRRPRGRVCSTIHARQQRGSHSASMSRRALLGSVIRVSRGVMDRSDVGGQLAHPRQEHVVLLVDVLVQIEFERGQRLEQRAVRRA